MELPWYGGIPWFTWSERYFAQSFEYWGVFVLLSLFHCERMAVLKGNSEPSAVPMQLTVVLDRN
jgi:hypothetical protein